MGWSNIVIEGFCFGDFPCGKVCPDPDCLGDSKGSCPHFAFSRSSERSAAFFVPLGFILWDKLKAEVENIYSILHWWVWGKWHFDKTWLSRVGTASPEVSRDWDKFLEDQKKEYLEWTKEEK